MKNQTEGINASRRNKLIKKFLQALRFRSFKQKGNLVQTIAVLSVYVAWFGLSTVAIYVGYIPIGNTQITYLAAIVVMATFHLGILGNIVTGLAFGLSSWIAAFIYGIPKYQLFDLAVLPRVEMALIVLPLFYIFNAFKKPKLWKLMLLSIFAVMLNQYLVLTAQYIRESIAGSIVGKGVPPIHIWLATHVINVVAEPIFGALLMSALYPVLLKVKRKYLDNIKIYY